MNLKSAFKALSMMCFVLLFQTHVWAQDEEVPKVTTKVALTNATITVSPGKTLQNANIILEDGLIKAVGVNAMIPFDAEVIPADSMHIYPGFIAALSHAGVPKPEDKKSEEKISVANPPNDKAGITPEQSLSEVYSSKEKMISDLRSQGFTTSHSVPQGRMLPGKGSVISLSGKAYDDVVIKKDMSVYAQLTGARRMFPATTIGVMAKFRDLYRDSEYANKYESKYAMNSKGLKRPNKDAATKGLYPVVSKKIPVFFRAEKALDAYRVLALQKDLGFDLVLSEMKQGAKLSNKLNRSSLLLSLDLPKKEKEEKKDDDKKDKGEDKQKDADKKSKKEIKKDKNPEKEALLAKSKASKEAYVAQAASFAKMSKPFSFSYLKVKPKDIKPNLQRMVKAGLSEEKALAALTTEAAKTIGVSNVAGTLDAGKLGNLVVTNKPYFDEKSKIKYVFVEGQKFEYEIKEKKKKSGAGEATGDISGMYSYEIEIPGMTRGGKMKIAKSGDSYDVSVSNDEAPDEYKDIEGVEMDGSNMSFEFSVEAEGMNMNLEMDLDFDGDTFEGTVGVGQFGSFPITGSKIDPNN